MTIGDAENIIGLYERHAGAWDRDRSRTLFERPWLDRFVACLPVGGTVLDLGCGMGEPIASFLAGHGFRVTGVDSSPAMLDKARARMPDQQWLTADIRKLDLGTRFDGIIAWDSFFHLTREAQRAMLPIFAAHAASGCALMFTSGPDDGEAMGTFENEPLYHASLAPEDYRSLLTRIGFEVVEHVANDENCGGHTIWLARRV